jgi:Negative regulator of sigma F
MNDRQINAILDEAARASHPVDPAVLERVTVSIAPSLKPVRPLPSTPILSAGLFFTCAAVSLIGAAVFGFYGIGKMTPWQRALVFSSLAALICISGAAFVNEMIPGSRRRISARALLATGIAVLLGVFAFLFRDYRIEHFVSAGIPCLVTGFLFAIPAAFLGWLVLRRGFAVNFISAGTAAGTLAGLAGVGLLELHCANFQAAHILVWHTAVIPLSAAAGALLGWLLRLLRLRPTRPVD